MIRERAGVIDLHCHVIPGVDDGPVTVEDSLALCRAALAAGTTQIIATPHLNWTYPDIDVAVVHEGVASVNAALEEAAIDVEIRTGAEIALSRLPDLSDEEIAFLRLGDGPYSLIECPHQGGAPTAIQEMLHRFAGSGNATLLAHPERCPVFQSNRRLLPALTEIGMLSCITARSLTGEFGATAREYAWELIASGHVHAIASDAHDAVGRPPDLASTLDRAGLSDAQIEYFAFAAPDAIVSGEPVPRPPEVVEQRSPSWLRRRGRLR
jgi:protein-tyrosine phosphatase